MNCIVMNTTDSLLHQSWGPFLESPVNLTGPKSNIQIEM